MIKLKSRLRELLEMDRPKPSMYADQEKLEIMVKVGRAVRHRDALDRIYRSLGYAASSEPVGLKDIESRIRSAIASNTQQQKVQELERLVSSYKKSNQILQDCINEINSSLPELAKTLSVSYPQPKGNTLLALQDAAMNLIQENKKLRALLGSLYTTSTHKTDEGKAPTQIQEELFRYIRNLQTENINLRHDILRYDQGQDKDNN